MKDTDHVRIRSDFHYNKHIHKFFGEWCPYTDDYSKIEAKKWLEKWKEILIFKLNRDSFHCKIVDEQWVERPSEIVSCLAHYASLGLKICLEAEWKYEL